MRRLVLLAALAATFQAGPALAHPQLVSATPAANSAVAKPTRLTLTFSEVLVASLSGIELTMTGMPGMANHAPMPIRGFTAQVAGKSITVTLPRAGTRRRLSGKAMMPRRANTLPIKNCTATCAALPTC